MLTSSAVVYRDGKEVFISNPTEFPDVLGVASKVKEIQEPVVKASIIVPEGERCQRLDFWFIFYYLNDKNTSAT